MLNNFGCWMSGFQTPIVHLNYLLYPINLFDLQSHQHISSTAMSSPWNWSEHVLFFPAQVAGVESVHREIANEGAIAIAASEKRLRDESSKVIEKLRQRLELETHKLEDCHREIENYRAHFEQTSVQVKLRSWKEFYWLALTKSLILDSFCQTKDRSSL